MNFFVYLVALAVSAATLAVSVELITRPDHEPVKQVAAATAPVRQIQIERTAEDAKQDAKPADANAAAVKPAEVVKPVVKPAEVKSNVTNAQAATADVPAVVSSNTVNIKPVETTGSAAPRVAEVPPVEQKKAPVAQRKNAAPERRVRSRAEELEEVARVVRRLPAPPSQSRAYDRRFDRYDRRYVDRYDEDRFIVMERRPVYGYNRRPGVYYEDD